jgi:hypothetical protein
LAYARGGGKAPPNYQALRQSKWKVAGRTASLSREPWSSGSERR